MLRGLLAAAVVSAAAFPATAAAENTPSGPATISFGFAPPVACVASFTPTVSVAWRVVVGEGGQGGTVRPVLAGVVGDPVELPATPGTYTFPAPHIFGGGVCSETVGIVQTTGSHAIVAGASENFLTIKRDGQADQRIDGARLTTSIITEPDQDGDLRGDLTEDRTDLRVTATPAREPDGRLRVEVKVLNAGPQIANLMNLEASPLLGGRWEGDCSPVWPYPRCVTPALAPGETRAFVLRADAPDAANPVIRTWSEGADLAPADNETTFALAAAPAFDLVAAATQRLRQGVKVQVRGVRAGRARVTVAFKVRGKSVKVAKIVTLAPYTARSVTIRATGAKLRSLRRHAPLDAEITVRTISGRSPVTATTRVTR